MPRRLAKRRHVPSSRGNAVVACGEIGNRARTHPSPLAQRGFLPSFPSPMNR
jgi:hypothetical protein